MKWVASAVAFTLVGGGGGEQKNRVVEVRWFSDGQSGCSSGRTRASFIAGLMN